MKILIVTKNHPIEAVDIMTKLYSYFGQGNLSAFTCVSPQYIAAMLEEVQDIPYKDAFYPAISTLSRTKNSLAYKTKNFVLVGTTDIKDRDWYDMVIGYDNKNIDNYKDLNENMNKYNIKCITLDDTDITFDDYGELVYFLRKVIKIGEKKNEDRVQSETIGSDK